MLIRGTTTKITIMQIRSRWPSNLNRSSCSSAPILDRPTISHGILLSRFANETRKSLQFLRFCFYPEPRPFLLGLRSETFLFFFGNNAVERNFSRIKIINTLLKLWTSYGEGMIEILYVKLLIVVDPPSNFHFCLSNSTIFFFIVCDSIYRIIAIFLIQTCQFEYWFGRKAV